MRLWPSNSVRTVALLAGFCALGIAAGCGRQSFDLLPEQSLIDANKGAGAGVLNSSGKGGTSGVSGKAGGGTGGRADAGGFGGRFPSFPLGGSGGNQPCLGEAGCGDEEPLPCDISLPFCNPCRIGGNECAFAFVGEATTCDPDLKRCVQCKKNSHCPPGEVCNTSTYRCAKACGGKEGCGFDAQHLFCSQEQGVCVACIDKSDCEGYGQFPPRCAANVCVQCTEDSQCPGQFCRNGNCTLH